LARKHTSRSFFPGKITALSFGLSYYKASFEPTYNLTTKMVTGHNRSYRRKDKFLHHHRISAKYSSSYYSNH
jgi:hypothetical protein